MTKEQIWALVRSLLMMTAVSFIMSLAITGKMFVWYWFVGIFIAQFLIFQIIAFVVDKLFTARFMGNLANANAVMQKTIFEQTLPLNCAYCNTVNENIPIIVSQENSFKCFQCEQENAIYMKFYAARKTVPVIRKAEAELLEKGTPE